jgi:hypothetical protein
VRLAQSVAGPIEGDPFIGGIVDGNPVVGASELVEAWAWAAIGAQLGGGAQTLTLAGAELLGTGVGQGRVRTAVRLNVKVLEGCLIWIASKRRGWNRFHVRDTRARPSEYQTRSPSSLKKVDSQFLRKGISDF